MAGYSEGNRALPSTSEFSGHFDDLFFLFFLHSCQTRGKEPHFPAICTAYNAAGGAPATICAFCVRVFCAPAVASATLVG